MSLQAKVADTDAGSVGYLPLVAVFAVGEDEHGLRLGREMRQRALEVNHNGR
jgi:hypothetical protein